MSTSFLNTQWRPKSIIACHVVSLLLLASWLWHPTRELWNALDVALFHLLNDPVHGGGWWATIWAIGSMRPVDMGVALVLLLVMVTGNLVLPRQQVRPALVAFVVLLLIMLPIRVLFTDLVEAMDWQRPSASLVVEGSARLTEMFPAWEERWDLKDSASRSFPGDHASVLLLWGVFMTLIAHNWRLLLVWGVVLIGILPRLVAGAHWGSDALVGSSILVLLGLAWGYFTPALYRATTWVERVSAPLRAHLRRLPLIGRLALLES